MSVEIKGDGLVAVWHSDPRWGDPYEGVFHMKPPYTTEQVKQQWQQKGRPWAKAKAESGFVMTTKPRLLGPFVFGHVQRHDLGEDHRDEDEYVIVVWFKRERPVLLATDAIEQRRVLAQRYGHAPALPTKGRDPVLSGARSNMADEFDPYSDPDGRDEQGMKTEATNG